MKIYFAGSIRGGREDAAKYKELIDYLKKYGEVLSEHFGSEKLTSYGEAYSDEFIHDRDMNWVLSSNAIIAEVTTPSLGVGYELGRALENNKPMLCLYEQKEGKRLSAMISGSKKIKTVNYKNLDEAKQAIDEFFKNQDLKTKKD
ncbi:nucleoside 2-deoxyribosyltransferase [Candidatus Micrarchaeota archaeon]|nr:nucleoside 2-deoxyribosyltransferase [Candidatus Micrarchaeota archaeon]